MSGGKVWVDLWFIQLDMLGEVSTGVVLSISIVIFDSRDMCNHRRGANRAVLPRRNNVANQGVRWTLHDS